MRWWKTAPWCVSASPRIAIKARVCWHEYSNYVVMLVSHNHEIPRIRWTKMTNHNRAHMTSESVLWGECMWLWCTRATWKNEYSLEMKTDYRAQMRSAWLHFNVLLHFLFQFSKDFKNHRELMASSHLMCAC